MVPTDRFDSALTDPAVVTRSDHAPSDFERYGEWARKFFGHGWHHNHKDSDATLAYLAEAETRH